MARARATAPTQLMYAPRFGALAQSHSAEAALCAALTAAASSHDLAVARVGSAAMPSQTASAPNANDFIPRLLSGSPSRSDQV